MDFFVCHVVWCTFCYEFTYLHSHCYFYHRLELKIKLLFPRHGDCGVLHGWNMTLYILNTSDMNSYKTSLSKVEHCHWGELISIMRFVVQYNQHIHFNWNHLRFTMPDIPQSNIWSWQWWHLVFLDCLTMHIDQVTSCPLWFWMEDDCLIAVQNHPHCCLHVVIDSTIVTSW